MATQELGDKMEEQTIPVFYSKVPVHLLVDVANFLRHSHHMGHAERRALDLASLLLKCTEEAAPGE